MAPSTIKVHPDALELAELLRPFAAQISAGIPAWHPRCEGEGDEGDGEGAEGEGSEGGGAGSGEGEEDGGEGRREPDWKAQSRKHERRAKEAAKKQAELEKQLADATKGQQSEHEKAIADAKKAARDEAMSEVQAGRRADRLESAVTRLSAKGVTVKVGDKDQTVRIADDEDALMHIERAIAKGDLDADDLFDDEGRVQTEALTEALTDLVGRKPHLIAGDTSAGAGAGKPRGSADAGRGKAAKALDDMSVEEHFNATRRGK